MDRIETTNDIIRIQEQLTQFLIPLAIDSWGKLNIPLTQLKSLFIIATRTNTNFRSLANHLGVTPGDVTGIVSRMVEQGLVKRNPDPEDRRVIWLEATEKGLGLVTNLIDIKKLISVNILDHMSAEELNSYHYGLKGLISAIKQLQEGLK